VLLAGCGGPSTTPQGGGSGERQRLLLVSYAVTKGAYDRILPKFVEQWKQKNVQELEIKTSYGGSGTQIRAVIDGLDADVVTLALSADVLKLEESGLIQPGWEQELPNAGIITNSALAFLSRPGNPKRITTWKDLVKPGVTVVTANPKTSGGARWNFLGLWGSITQAGGTSQQAEAYVTSVYKNVDNLPKDVREASDVFLKRDHGDVLLNYENEAILATKISERKGFRPTSPAVWARVNDRFAPVKQFFSVKDFGGWAQVNKQFFGDDGIWDRLFANSR
jgi:sulfate transport system substrate-binding protein